jgi:surface protein
MFSDCYVANPDVSGFDTSQVTNMYAMFYNCQVANPDVSNFNTSQVTDMGYMFLNCYEANPDVSNFDTSQVTNMYAMFYNCQVANPDVSNFNTSQVTNMRSMFYNCQVANPDVSNFNTSQVTDMRSMFYNCYVANPDVSNFNTSQVTNMGYMFSGADSWTEENYNKAISAWHKYNVQSGVSFDSYGRHHYSGEPSYAIAKLTDLGWTITDAGRLGDSDVTYVLPEGYSPAYVVPLSERQVFPYRSTLTVNNPHTDNYPVQKTVAWETGMETDFSDVWFIDATTYKRCPHWIESYTSGTSAVMWIQTPANMSSVYMLFGESTVEDVSNIEQVFILGDDGNGSELNSNKWKLEVNNPWYPDAFTTVSNSVISISPHSSTTTGLRTHSAIVTRLLLGKNVSVIFRDMLEGEGRYITSGFGDDELLGESGTTAATWSASYGLNSIQYSRGRYSDAGGQIYTVPSYGTRTNLNTSIGQTHPVIDTFYTEEIHWTDDKFEIFRDGTSLGSTTNTDYLDRLSSGFFYIGKGSYDGMTTLTDIERHIDWVGIREYVATEPTISIGTAGANPEYVGGEEPTYNLLVGFTGSNF